MPANLPVFDALRNEDLNQLDLKEYMCRKDDKEETEPQKVAEALAPELFMLALSEAHVHMERTPVRRRNGAILRCHARTRTETAINACSNG